MTDDLNQPATKDWIIDRWGGFDYIVSSGNRDFMLDFCGTSLWLHFESADYRIPCSRLRLKEKPTRSDVIEIEKLFSCGDVQ